jgi:hypothetical protein
VKIWSKAMAITPIPIKDADDVHNCNETQNDFNSSLVELLNEIDWRFSCIQAFKSAPRFDA